MSTIGSTSLWQQDQDYWADQQSFASSNAATTSLITAISTAETNQGKGLAAIANQTALNRTNSQLSAAIQSVLSGTALSSITGASSSSSSATSSAGAPATGTGKTPVTVGTSLTTLGIPAGATFTVSAGGNTTTYATTGSDTIGNLISAINTPSVGNAAVTASLGKDGNLILTSKNKTDTITVGGVYAAKIGFGVGNNTFKPTAATAPAASTTASTSTTTSTKSTTSTAKSYSTLASEGASSAASLLSDSGVSGSLVDMLA